MNPQTLDALDELVIELARVLDRRGGFWFRRHRNGMEAACCWEVDCFATLRLSESCLPGGSTLLMLVSEPAFDRVSPDGPRMLWSSPIGNLGTRFGLRQAVTDLEWLLVDAAGYPVGSVLKGDAATVEVGQARLPATVQGWRGRALRIRLDRIAATVDQSGQVVYGFTPDPNGQIVELHRDSRGFWRCARRRDDAAHLGKRWFGAAPSIAYSEPDDPLLY